MSRTESTVADLSELALFGLSDAEVSDAVGRLDSVMSRLAGLAATLVREAEARALPAQLGYSSVGVWLREHHRMSHSRSRQLLQLGRVLAARPVLRSAISDGRVSAEQAAVVGAAVESLASRVEPAIVDKAETALVDFADQFHPAALGALSERILGHVAPEIAEEQEAAQLARLERRAHDTRSLTLTPESGTGRTRLSGWLTAEAAAIVTAALDPLARPNTAAMSSAVTGADDPDLAESGSPRAVASGAAVNPVGAPSDTATRDPRTPAQRRADALIEVCRLALNTGELPDSGGQRPQLAVCLDYDSLKGQLGAGMLDDGRAITPQTVRRLACDAALIPAVLGSHNEVLDLGRAARVWTGPARRALILRDRGCAFPGCDRPARWCDAHHILHWIDGGATDLDNGVLLCGFHHRLIHQSGWQVRLGDDRRPEFIPPPELDPLQRPRRNPYHRRE